MLAPDKCSGDNKGQVVVATPCLSKHKIKISESQSLPCPAFSSLVVMEDGLSEWIFTRESFTEDYVLLLFLPMDGSVDKVELEAFSAELDQLASLGCQVGN